MAASLLAPPTQPPGSEEPESEEPVGVRADEPSAKPQSPPVARRDRVIVGITSGDPQITGEELHEALAGHLAGTSLRHRVALLSRSGDRDTRLDWASTFVVYDDVLAVFWVSGRGERQQLYLFEPKSGATWVRELPPASDPDALLESLGAMVRYISLWLERGPPPGMVEVEPPPKPPPKAPPQEPPPQEPPPREPPPPPSVRWALELHYAGGNLADPFPWQSGGGLGLEVETPVHVVGRLTASVLGPAVLRSVPRTTVWRIPLSLGVGYRFAPDRALRPLLDASVVVDPMVWQARGAPGVDARSGRGVRVAIAPGAGLRWILGRGVFLMLHVRADLWVLNADLVVSVDNRQESRLSPHPVSGLARVGVGYAF
ncbi:MAG: hypothetical protein AAGF11_47725 [Myxococcota bacterium]